MADRPIISVITVTLNCARAAVETATSVLSQEYPDYEYIVKDGLSSDTTVVDLKALGVERIYESPDSGIYDAMNQALELCRGKYVYFLNAGDTFYSTQVLKSLAEQMGGLADVLYGDLNLIPLDRIAKPAPELTRRYLFRKNVNHQAFVAKLAAYRNAGGFDLQYKYVADQHFLFDLILNREGRAKYIPVIFANFVYGGASTERSVRSAVRSERWKLLSRHFSLRERILFGASSLYFLNPLKAWVWEMVYGDRIRSMNG